MLQTLNAELEAAKASLAEAEVQLNDLKGTFQAVRHTDADGGHWVERHFCLVDRFLFKFASISSPCSMLCAYCVPFLTCAALRHIPAGPPVPGSMDADPVRPCGRRADHIRGRRALLPLHLTEEPLRGGQHQQFLRGVRGGLGDVQETVGDAELSRVSVWVLSLPYTGIHQHTTRQSC